MQIVSFNVNGLRSRLHQMESLVEAHQPDVIGLQETKVVDESFPLQALLDMGYHVSYHGQKGHYGVALMSKQPHKLIAKGFPNEPEDAQRRFIAIEIDSDYGPITLMNGYFPQGESRSHAIKFPYKEKFYQNLHSYLQNHFKPTDAVALMGDFNIAYQDQDIGIGDESKKRWLRTGKCSFLPEERQWFSRLLNWGLTDSFRHCYPDENDQFSWFDYRSGGFKRTPKRGLRIDGVLLSDKLLCGLKEAEIGYTIRAMEKPSDHAPVWVKLSDQSPT